MSRIRLDPRYLILIFLLSFVLAGQFYLGFYQKWDSIIASILSATITETIWIRLKRKQWIFPLSALISGIGIGLLISSYLIWPYILASMLAISLKHIIKVGGRHVFNPNNIAIVSLLFLIPQYVVNTPKQWTNGIEVMVLILVLGSIAAYVANRLDTVIAFISSFAFFAMIRVEYFGEPVAFAFGPLLGASFQLFTFFMLTDPQTTPVSRNMRIVLAVLIAFVDMILRLQSVTNSFFYAAFLVTLFVGLPYRLWLKKADKHRKNTIEMQ